MHTDLERQRGSMTQRNLRSLPQEMQPPYGWDEFQRRAHDRVQAAALRRSNARAYVAIAAALVVIVVGIATWTRIAHPGVSQPVATRENPVPVLAGDPGTDSPGGVDPHAVAVEHLPVSVPSEPAVVRVGTRAAEAGLEDRIAQLDDLLSAARAEGALPARVAEMQQQRALLVSALWQVRYAEVLVADSR